MRLVDINYYIQNQELDSYQVKKIDEITSLIPTAYVNQLDFCSLKTKFVMIDEKVSKK